MNIAFVGCGAQADLYMHSLGSHLDLRLVGVFDPDAERRQAFANTHQVPAFDNLDALLADPALDLVVILAPLAHRAAVTREALEAGKHVFSEPPLAATPKEAGELAKLAADRKLQVGIGPATHLSESVQTLGQALRAGKLGTPLMAFAEMSMSGAGAEGNGAGEGGDFLARASLQVAPLVFLFGPVKRVTALAGAAGDMPAVADATGPATAFGLLEFEGGLVARLTVSTLGPLNRSLRVVGSEATATMPDVMDFATQPRLAKTTTGGLRDTMRGVEGFAQRWAPGLMLGTKMTPARPVTMKRPKGNAPALDAARGVAALVEAVRGGPNRVSTDLGFHIADVVQALAAKPGAAASVTEPKTKLDQPPPPFDWAM